MNDPRLNSVHLPAARKDKFREARTDLLNSCGVQTLAGEQNPVSISVPNTAIVDQDPRIPPGTQFVLVDQQSVYPLKTGINTVGRLPDNDVVLSDPYVSRRHVAILVHAQNGCELHDIASKNGTLLNGQPIQGRIPLKQGDQIQLSDVVLTFLCKSTKSGESDTEHTLSE